MEINVVLEYFDKLNDENAMFIEFKNGGQLLVDDNDIIRVNGDLIEITSTSGTYVTSYKNVVGLKICNRVDIIKKTLLADIVEATGE